MKKICKILSVIFTAILMIWIGVQLSIGIAKSQISTNEAMRIDSQEDLKKSMDSCSGDAWIYGDLEAADTVSLPEITGKYMYIVKVKEKYTELSAKRRFWDEISKKDLKCREVIFCGLKFSSDKIHLPDAHYICTIEESESIRYKYYGAKTKYTGTLAATLRDGTISESSNFFVDSTITQAIILARLKDYVLFWIMWIFVIIITEIFFVIPTYSIKFERRT